jgi:PPP family 3-phenylpropionic acid transporter
LRRAYPFTFYFLYFAALACLAPFVVLFYQQLGFSGAQIGLLAGIAPLITLVSAPLWTGFADATRRHRLLMSLAIAGAVIGALVFPGLRTLGPVVVLVVLFSFFTAPISPFADSATMNMLAGRKDQYGRVRIGGTFGWGIFALVAGIAIQAFGLKLAFWGYAALMFLALLVCQRFVFSRAATGVSLRGGVRTLMANRRWVLFLALAFVGGVGFAAVNTYLFAYMQELNASKTTMGLALTFSTLAELPVLFYADRLLKRFKAHGLFVLAMVVTGIRLLLYAAVSFPAGVLFFQILNGFTFPAAWVAGVTYADENAPPAMSATAQGLFGAMVFGFGAAAGGLLGGLLLESIGGRGMYLVIGLAMLIGTAIITLMERRLPAITSTSSFPLQSDAEDSV